ncbi:acetolactate synthase AlsS [Kocuria soli]|uniref:Acetolactate synthase AlsS n=1 Tax=Kocuria soli TaxID=2485125 RepID=A0A3N3ZRI7_9MICC|nr:acetolactate synthase AlsS [Kocuria soli]ROZ63960.1 acetolactate synthase AlsS [Kocuria soli]
MSENEIRSAQLVVDTLREQGVKYVFGVPGAKIDSVYDALVDAEDIQLVVCRHEQNAVFMAQAVGRLTGVPGVVLVTSGPGTTNLATGLLTATTEQDPVVAIAGTVGLPDRLKRTHQSLDAVNFLAPVTKSSVESTDPSDVPEALANAFRAATTEPKGAAAVMLPDSVTGAKTDKTALRKKAVAPQGPAAQVSVDRTVEALRQAQCPVLLVGLRGADYGSTAALRELVAATGLPVVETFQAAGAISRDLEKHFLGRVGLFRNQPGDILLSKADVVLTVGYDTVEYDPIIWNTRADRQIIHLDAVPADLDHAYQPRLELRGDIAATLEILTERLRGMTLSQTAQTEISLQRDALAEYETQARAMGDTEQGVNPAHLTLVIRDLIDDDKSTVAADIGSHSIYLARYFRTYEPRTLLFSNGQQTLGVALPWAIGAALVRPEHPVVSVSGDGGFLYSAQDLETATRLGLNMVHVIMRDNAYDMVAFQQMMKYGRKSGVELGDYDAVKYAESMGATGRAVRTMDEFKEAFTQAMAEPGVSIVDVAVDYTDNVGLAAHLDDSAMN